MKSRSRKPRLGRNFANRTRLLGLESLEARRVLAVQALNITAITSTADTDGGQALNVAVVAGSTVTVDFSYSSDLENATTAKFDVDTSPTTVATGFVTVASGAGKNASLSVVIPAGTAPGTYNAHVQLKNGSGAGSTANDSEEAAVDVYFAITVVDTELVVTAADAAYTGSAYDIEANITTDVNPDDQAGVLSYTFYNVVNGVVDVDSATDTAPTNVGDYAVVVHFESDDPDAYTSVDSDYAYFSITQAQLTADNGIELIDIQQSTLNLTSQGYVTVAIKLSAEFDVNQLLAGFVEVEGNVTYNLVVDSLTNTLYVSVKATDILASYLDGDFADTDSGWTQEGKGANAAYKNATTFDVAGECDNFAFSGLSDTVNLLLSQKAAASIGLIS